MNAAHQYQPVFVQDKLFGFYTNFPQPLANDFQDYELTVVDEKFNILAQNIAPLQRAPIVDPNDVDAGIHLYTHNNTFPSFDYKGVGYFLIIKNDRADVRYISNPIQIITESMLNCSTIVPVRYRSNAYAYSTYYNLATEFEHAHYLNLILHQPTPGEQSNGYEDTSGVYQRTRSVMRKTGNVATQWFDDKAHEAFNAMCSHEILFIDGIAYRKDNASYEVAWPEGGGSKYGYPFACGQITLEDLAYASNETLC